VIACVTAVNRFEAIAVEPRDYPKYQQKNKAAKTTEAAEHSGSFVHSTGNIRYCSSHCKASAEEGKQRARFFSSCDAGYFPPR
jgi:hypothetical protein